MSYNLFLEREDIEAQVKSFLASFDREHKNLNFKKGIYFYGLPGSGKTHFVTRILKEMNYDVITFDAGSVRNKALIDAITSNNMSRQNVLNIMCGNSAKKIAILMDEIDGMNNGDKGGITSLIKLIRQKKTKKQKLEAVAFNPIICVGNYNIDKKIKELMKVCLVFELKMPTHDQVLRILRNIYPHMYTALTAHQQQLPMHVLDIINGDLRKIDSLQKLYLKNPTVLSNVRVMKQLFLFKNFKSKDTKDITRRIMHTYMPMTSHSTLINETDRTIVGLLYHENIADVLKNRLLSTPHRGGGGGRKRSEDDDAHLVAEFYNFYSRMLRNMCYADYIDRITFQYQIWIFNEMSSLLKTFFNNYLFHRQSVGAPNVDTVAAAAAAAAAMTTTEVRFTKVLTKYSTEYNNQLFLHSLCISLQMDKKDLFAFFRELRLHSGNESMLVNVTVFQKVYFALEKYNLSKLDIKRIYRYLDKNIKNDFSSSSSSSSVVAVSAADVVTTNIIDDDDDDDDYID